jgi:hypothetical protein
MSTFSKHVHVNCQQQHVIRMARNIQLEDIAVKKRIFFTTLKSLHAQRIHLPSPNHASVPIVLVLLILNGILQWRKVFTTCSIRLRQRGQLLNCEQHVIQQHIWPHLQIIMNLKTQSLWNWKNWCLLLRKKNAPCSSFPDSRHATKNRLVNKKEPFIFIFLI